MRQAFQIAKAASSRLPHDRVDELIAEVTSPGAVVEDAQTPAGVLQLNELLGERMRLFKSFFREVSAFAVLLLLSEFAIWAVRHAVVFFGPPSVVRAFLTVVGWFVTGIALSLLVLLSVAAMRLLQKKRQMEFESKGIQGLIKIREERSQLVSFPG